MTMNSIFFLVLIVSYQCNAGLLDGILSGTHTVHSKVHDIASSVFGGLTQGANFNIQGQLGGFGQKPQHPQQNPSRPGETVTVVVVEQPEGNQYRPGYNNVATQNPNGYVPQNNNNNYGGQNHHYQNPGQGNPYLNQGNNQNNPGYGNGNWNGNQPNYGQGNGQSNENRPNNGYGNGQSNYNIPNNGYGNGQSNENRPNNGYGNGQWNENRPNNGYGNGQSNENRPNNGYGNGQSNENRPNNGYGNGHSNENRPNNGYGNGQSNENRPNNGYGNGNYGNDQSNYGNSNNNGNPNVPVENLNQDRPYNQEQTDYVSKEPEHNTPTYSNVNNPSTEYNYGQETPYHNEKTTKKPTDDAPLLVPLNPNEYIYGGDKVDVNAPKRETNDSKPTSETDEDDNFPIDERFQDD